MHNTVYMWEKVMECSAELGTKIESNSLITPQTCCWTHQQIRFEKYSHNIICSAMVLTDKWTPCLLQFGTNCTSQCDKHAILTGWSSSSALQILTMCCNDLQQDVQTELFTVSVSFGLWSMTLGLNSNCEGNNDVQPRGFKTQIVI